MIDLTDWKYAEPIYHFMQIPDNYEQYQEVRELESLSLAEFVQRYKLEEFEEWYKDKTHLFEYD